MKTEFPETYFTLASFDSKTQLGIRNYFSINSKFLFDLTLDRFKIKLKKIRPSEG